MLPLIEKYYASRIENARIMNVYRNSALVEARVRRFMQQKKAAPEKRAALV
jgi:hypothetical protein